MLLLRTTPGAAQTPLPIPGTVSGTTIDLSVQEGTIEFHPGEVVNTFGYNGSLLGPTIVLDQGQTVTMNVTNNLPDLTNIHWHGFHVAPEDDGPSNMIMPGSTWSPTFTVADKAGTYIYHPHVHGMIDFQVSMGLAGMIIVRDAEEAALDLPRTYGVDDIPVVLQTKAIVGGQIALHTGLDSIVVTNGVREATITLPAQVVRLRCLNGSSERTFRLGLSNGATFHTIGTDGGLLAAPVALTRQFLSNGERAEILLDLTGMEGQTFDLMSYGSELPNGVMGSPDVSYMGTTPDAYYDNALNGSDFRVLRITVGPQTANPVTAIPATLANVTPLQEADATVTRSFKLDPEVMAPMGMVEGPIMIDSALYQMSVINEVVELGTTEIWEFVNNTAVGHPMHIHGIQFYVLDRNGAPVPAQEQGRKDVVFVPPMGSVRVITKFEDFADPVLPYVYHCHILMHEDEGMMAQFLVIDPSAIGEATANTGSMDLWPNPSVDGLVRIRTTDANGPAVVQVVDATGRTVVQRRLVLQHGSASLDLGYLSRGPYLVKLLPLQDRAATLSAPLILQH